MLVTCYDIHLRKGINRPTEYVNAIMHAVFSIKGVCLNMPLDETIPATGKKSGSKSQGLTSNTFCDSSTSFVVSSISLHVQHQLIARHHFKGAYRAT